MSSSPTAVTKGLAKISLDVPPRLAAYEWVTLGQGSYNMVWMSKFASPKQLVAGESYQGPWVLKYAIPYSNSILTAMSYKDREIRLWNEINSTLPKAGPYKLGWVAPAFLDTRPATDTEIVPKLLEIYRNTRRIIVDAATKGNFLTRVTGEVILVDVDFAIKRSTSRASLDFCQTLDERYASYWADRDLQRSMPKTIEMTRNLLFLEENLNMESIDLLHADGHITVENVRTLTWFRTHKKPLSIDLFREISTLNETGLEMTDELLDALCTTIEPSPSKSLSPHPQPSVKATPGLGFFTPSSDNNTTGDDGYKNTDDVDSHAKGLL